MSSSNGCFLTCIQVSQEAGKIQVQESSANGPQSSVPFSTGKVLSQNRLQCPTVTAASEPQVLKQHGLFMSGMSNNVWEAGGYCPSLCPGGDPPSAH